MILLRSRAVFMKYLLFFSLLILILFLSIHLIQRSHAASSVSDIYVAKKDGIFYSSAGSNDFVEISKGLPESIIPLRLYKNLGDDDHIYLTTESQGLFRLDIENMTWHQLAPPSFMTRSLYRKTGRYRKITAFAIDQLNSTHLLCATKHSIYESFDHGSTWNNVSINGLGSSNYVTSLAVKGRTIAAGTSFNGIYIYTPGRFISSSKGLPREPYSKSLFFFDEVSCLWWKPHSKTIYAGFSSGKGLYVSHDNGRSWVSTGLSIKESLLFSVDDIYENAGQLYAAVQGTLYTKQQSGAWRPCERQIQLPRLNDKTVMLLHLTNPGGPLFTNLRTSAAQHPNRCAENRRAIYTNVYTITKELKTHIDTIKKCGFNAVVIDIKDDFGYIHIPVKNIMAQEIRAVKKTLPIKKILTVLKDEKIYSIARIVVFKDRQLYQAYDGKYAIKDKKTGKSWKGNPREYWVDPYAEQVHTYNIAIARECRELGFNEIQFDYIRFPSDGDLSRCSYTFCKDATTYKSEVLCDFLFRARSELDAVISTDIYGFNSWYRFGNTIGQDMEEFAKLVDVICPMVYPSHFGNRFYMQGPRSKRPYRIVYDGGIRALNICGPVLIRPYLQAFRLMSPTWGPDYITSQATAAQKSGCSGFTYWNASGNYDILKKAFSKKKHE